MSLHLPGITSWLTRFDRVLVVRLWHDWNFTPQNHVSMKALPRSDGLYIVEVPDDPTYMIRCTCCHEECFLQEACAGNTGYLYCSECMERSPVYVTESVRGEVLAAQVIMKWRASVKATKVANIGDNVTMNWRDVVKGTKGINGIETIKSNVHPESARKIRVDYTEHSAIEYFGEDCDGFMRSFYSDESEYDDAVCSLMDHPSSPEHPWHIPGLQDRSDYPWFTSSRY